MAIKQSIKDRAMAATPQTVTATPVATPPLLSDKPKTGPGMTMAFMERESKNVQENAALKAELESWEGSSHNQKLDPTLIKPSKWANRNEQSFHRQEWEEFKAEIKSAGGNIQPIKVRGVFPKNTPLQTYEIIFGHRRHRACLELGIAVFALIEDASDKQLFEEMDRENRQREDLTPYEQGEMYRKALDEGLYPSMRNMVESLQVNLGNASTYIKLARMPDVVLDAFEARLDIQQRWIKPLAGAIEKNPDHTLATAKEICGERENGAVIKSSEVFKRLTSDGVSAPAVLVTRSVKLPGKATLQVTTQGQKLKLEFDLVEKVAAKIIEKAVVDALIAMDANKT